MNRRNLLKTTASAAALTMTGPLASRQQ
ncbi:MAG: twin-arginine translocation signal domain-containing protein [Sphingobacteriaceae bacterium]|nr:twin-arginine translocation signal domain-containing protein [Cytophagaceae bacterium]